jgi:hypothetical protein
MKTISYILLISIFLCLNGCAAVEKNLKENKKAVIKYPSKAGEAAGLIVGIPTSIVLMPATIMLGDLIQNEEQRAWLPILPAAICAELGTVSVGGVPWLLFDRWGNDLPQIETKTQTETYEPIEKEEVVKYEARLSSESNIIITQTNFKSSSHTVEFYGEGSGRYPVKIDGQYFYGNDFDLPVWAVTDLRIIYQGVEYQLDHSLMYDMWQKQYEAKDHFLLSCDIDSCKLKGLFGDAAGSFTARWTFGNGVSSRTYLGASEIGMFPLSEISHEENRPLTNQ